MFPKRRLSTLPLLKCVLAAIILEVLSMINEVRFCQSVKVTLWEDGDCLCPCFCSWRLKEYKQQWGLLGAVWSLTVLHSLLVAWLLWQVNIVYDLCFYKNRKQMDCELLECPGLNTKHSCGVLAPYSKNVLHLGVGSLACSWIWVLLATCPGHMLSLPPQCELGYRFQQPATLQRMSSRYR